MRLLIRLAVSAAIIFGVARFSGGALLEVDGWAAAFWAALVLGLANAIVKPIVHLIALPVTILTLGLFSLAINAFMLYIVQWLVPGFDTVGFWRTILAALLISILTSIATKALERSE